jgi:hypothetical protein
VAFATAQRSRAHRRAEGQRSAAHTYRSDHSLGEASTQQTQRQQSGAALQRAIVVAQRRATGRRCSARVVAVQCIRYRKRTHMIRCNESDRIGWGEANGTQRISENESNSKADGRIGRPISRSIDRLSDQCPNQSVSQSVGRQSPQSLSQSVGRRFGSAISMPPPLPLLPAQRSELRVCG